MYDDIFPSSRQFHLANKIIAAKKKYEQAKTDFESLRPLSAYDWKIIANAKDCMRHAYEEWLFYWQLAVMD